MSIEVGADGVRAEAPIAFNETTLVGSELAYVRQALESGRVSSSGPFALQTAELLREVHDAAKVFMTTSCTDALEMAAMLTGIKPGDVVVVPSFTFVSTALAFVRQGASLLFADIERDTLGIDPAHVAELLDDGARAVVPVHYAGVACDLDGLARAVEAAPNPVDLIEDNAQGLFASYKGRPLGSYGRFSVLSFHETKNFVCGEGGALVVNRDADVDRAHVLYDKGTNRQAFMLGLVDKYSWVDVGSSFGMSDLLAAYLFAQLEARDRIVERRRLIWERYDGALAPAAGALGFETPRVPPEREHSYHMYYVLLPDRASRDHTLSALRARNVQATFHYVPLHSAPGAQPHLARPAHCPVTDEISGRLLRLPFHNALTDEQVDRVAETFVEVVSAP